MSNSVWVQEAEERGYREALLDVYLFMTWNDGAFDIAEERFNLISAMIEQVGTTRPSRV